jgi:hypothetical protein
MRNKAPFLEDAICGLCCGQDGVGAYAFDGELICEDCFHTIMGDLETIETGTELGWGHK